MSRALVKRIFKLQLLLCGALYLLSVLAFVVLTDGITERFTQLAQGPYLSSAIAAQISLIPAYFMFAVMLTALSLPLSRLFSPSDSALRLVLKLLAIDVGIAVLALGPVLRRGPGLVDIVARKLPTFDFYVLYRWHVLDGLSMAFTALVLLSVIVVLRSLDRKVAAGLLLVATVSLAASQHRSPPKVAVKTQHPNVLIIATDSWRFDRVGIHGATHADLTPNIDAFAKRATDFTNLHVATASTLESWVTLLTGLLPSMHGIRSMYPSGDEVRAVDQLINTLPRLLNAQGYSTFVSSDWVGNCFDLVDLGFTSKRVGEIQNFKALLTEATVKAHPLVPLYLGGLPGLLGDTLVPGRSSLVAHARPEALVDHLFDDIDVSVTKAQPFFGVLFLSPTHLPYSARYPFNLKYGTPGYTGAHRYQVEVSAHQLITTGFSPTLEPATIEHIRDLYDNAVSDFDDSVGNVLARLDQRGLTENTVVIITTDHGEDLYDPGSTLGHGTNFFGGDQSTHIPFLLRMPDQQHGSSFGALARTVDIAPTLLSLLQLPVPAAMQGVNLVPVMKGEAPDPQLLSFAETCYLFFPKASAMTVLSEAERANAVELSGAADTLEVDASFRHNLVLRPQYRQAVIAAKDRMVRSTRWKLIEIPGKAAPIRRLYDLQNDPLQRQNLAGQGLPEEVELAALLDQQNCRASHP